MTFSSKIKFLIFGLIATIFASNAYATNATSLICGSDPTILTPLYPIRAGSSGPELMTRPDITFTFDGQRPCLNNRCNISIRSGDSMEQIANIELPSESITYCRQRDPFFQWPIVMGDKEITQCKGGLYANTRIIALGESVDDIDVFSKPYILIQWFQKKVKSGPPISACLRKVFDDESTLKEKTLIDNYKLVKFYEHNDAGDIEQRKFRLFFFPGRR
ncbi:hypothetical protein [Microvirga flavescens]|uniref:hypothetical protein n=1 Tax=Microvirga flavescens TaxID=2249811 RepID=UPI00130097E6|nr:hypothetical protein [Microvirga flavescens]